MAVVSSVRWIKAAAQVLRKPANNLVLFTKDIFFATRMAL
jgi:hypothetical protein